LEHISDIFNQKKSRAYIPDMTDGNGVAFRDVNGDGLPDIYMICFSGNNRLLLNSGAYRPFKDVTQIAGLYGNLRPEGVYNFESGRTIYDLKIGTTIVDIDNDDDGDVIITGRGISTALYRNNGSLKFENITAHLDLYPPIEANSCVSADVNNDRYLDLFITDGQYSNRMLINQGDGFFKDLTTESGLWSDGKCLGASFSDIDRDGDQDLYVCRRGLPDLLYNNIGDGVFEIVNLPLTTLIDSVFSVAVTFGDIDNDADIDMLITNDKGKNFLYYNETQQSDTLWKFKESYLDYLGTTSSSSKGSVIADFNNDGYQDIFITNDGPNELFLNQRNGLFNRLSHRDEVKDMADSRGVAAADFDLDGNVDLFVSNRNEPSVLYINSIETDNFIKFKLTGISSNTDAIGSLIEIYTAGHRGENQYLLGSRELAAGSGYFSLNEPIIHFGLDTTKIVDARIYFPSGVVVEESNLSVGETYSIFEYTFSVRAVILAIQHVEYLMQQPVFWYQVLLVLLFFALIFVFVRLGAIRYKWSAGTASGYLVGFFLLALIALTALKKLGLLYIFSIIDLLTLVFVAIFFINSERLYRLRLIRERYRTVLINLSNQIVNIHDDQDLFETVIENISQNTEFDKTAVLPINQINHTLQKPVCHGLSLKLTELKSFDLFPEIFSLLKANNYIEKDDEKQFLSLFDTLSSVIVIAIQRNNNLFGILSLGTEKPVSPLTMEDIDLFVSLGNQMAIAIENNEYIKRSTEMIKQLTEAEVREKYLKELETTNAILDSKNQDLQRLYDELKNTQAQLIHSEKMASLGQLVAGISHELNNPIGFIYANIKQLKSYTDKIEKFTKNLSDDKTPGKAANTAGIKIDSLLPDLKNLIADTINGSQIVKNLVENLRRFSHLDQAQWAETDIHEGIESSLMILNPELKNRITIEKKYSATRKIECNPGQINQVFLNILSNAAQAIEGEGKIIIETCEREEWLLIRFTDNGNGIPQKIISKIFDPFFTTKDVGKGTGLGLSISYSIIKDHGGKIEVESNTGEGSVFSIMLPYTIHKQQSEIL
jgi:signal transduction histidine kinase